jgi:hypothetical protein
MWLCVERIIPLRKGRPVVFDLPAIETAADVANALGAIAGAMAAGELTLDEAGAVAGVIEAKRRAIETVEHEERLQKLEEAALRPMRTQIASRLTRLERNTGRGSRRIVVVEKNSLEAARAFLQGRADVDMDRITFVMTGRANAGAIRNARARVQHDRQRVDAARSQANRVLALLSKMLSLAEAWGYRPDGSNPCRHIEKYKEQARQRYLSNDELRRLGVALDELATNSAHGVYAAAACCC